MHFLIESSSLFESLMEAVENAIEKEFQDDNLSYIGVSTKMLTSIALKEVQKLRTDEVLYDALNRSEYFKPCKNYRLIADRIVEDLEHQLHCSEIPRAYAYKTLFIMYLLFERIPASGKSKWWETEFKKKLPDYLESTNYFSGVNCRYRLSVVLDQLPDPVGRLPLEIPIEMPKPHPNYPPVERPIQIITHPNIYIGDRTEIVNNNCQQFYGQISKSSFQ